MNDQPSILSERCPKCGAPDGVPCQVGVIFRPFHPSLHPHRLTLEQFREGVTSGFFTDDDGVAELATSGDVSNIELGPSELSPPLVRVIPAWATHVVWYNK